jgi:hypothetical protein
VEEAAARVKAAAVVEARAAVAGEVVARAVVKAAATAARVAVSEEPDRRLMIIHHAIDSRRLIISLGRLAVKAAAVAEPSSAQGTHIFIALIGKKSYSQFEKYGEIKRQATKTCDD